MKKIILITIAVILCSVCFVAYKFFNATKVEDTSTKNIKQNNNMLSMMIEIEAGSGKYEMTSTSSWPIGQQVVMYLIVNYPNVKMVEHYNGMIQTKKYYLREIILINVMYILMCI